MDDARTMRRVHGGGKRLHQLGRRTPRLRGPFEPIGEASPFQQLEHHEGPAVVFTEVVDMDDIRMAKAGDGLGLDPEPRPDFGAGVLAVADHLQRNDTVQRTVAGLVDHPHAPAAELGQDLEIREAKPRVDAERGAGQPVERAAGTRTACRWRAAPTRRPPGPR